MGPDRISDRFESSSGGPTTLKNRDATIKTAEDGERKHTDVPPTPPVVIPTVPSIHGNDEILPADADNRDQEVDQEKSPDGNSSDAAVVKEPDIYDRFTPGKKRAILAIVSYSAFISPVTSSIFLPSIPEMSVDLDTTPTVINITVAIFLVTIGVAPLFWSPLSGFYGRRPIYLASMPIHVAASIGVALSNNVGALIGTRILQGFGGSCVLAVGAGSVGDIFRPTERANAMGWFYSGALMGPSISPILGGVFTEYTAQSWRASQYFLAGCGVLSIVLVYFFLPETSHPPLPHDKLKKESGKKFVVYFFNPLTSLGLFRWWNIVAAAFVSSCVMMTTYAFVVPLATVFKTQYGVNNTVVAGALYLASGGSNVVAGRVAGLAQKYIAKRGYRRPEDRLRAAVWAVVIVMPLSCLGYGWLLRYAAGGMGPPIVMMMFSAAALMFILTPVNTYLIDCMQSRSAELIAVNNFMRYCFAAGASALTLPMANSIGWGWTMTIAAVISWLAAATILATIRWGHIWREKSDAKYGVAPAADTRLSTHSKDEEAAVGEKSRTSEAHEHEIGEDPGYLVSPPTLRNVGRTNTSKEITGLKGGSRLTRQASTRSEMPPVEEVLKRTVSLSQASLHGG